MVGLGTRTPEYEIKAEIKERQAILDGLPLRLQDSESGDSHQSSVDEQRSIIESEIYRLNMEITWFDLGDMGQPIGEPFDVSSEISEHPPQLYLGHIQSSLALPYMQGYEAGRKFERRQHQSAGGKKKSEKYYKESIEYCISRASEIWKRPPILRMGEMAEKLVVEMIHRGIESPEVETIKRRLNKAAKEGKLEIPPKAQKRGRPKKNKT